jgi:hypothetical protein
VYDSNFTMENYDVHGNEHLHHNERAVETVNVDVNGKEEHLHCNEDVPCDKYVETRMKGNVDGETTSTMMMTNLLKRNTSIVVNFGSQVV